MSRKLIKTLKAERRLLRSMYTLYNLQIELYEAMYEGDDFLTYSEIRKRFCLEIEPESEKDKLLREINKLKDNK